MIGHTPDILFNVLDRKVHRDPIFDICHIAKSLYAVLAMSIDKIVKRSANALLSAVTNMRQLFVEVLDEVMKGGVCRLNCV